MINLSRVALAAMWPALLYATFHAGEALGWDKAGGVFLADMVHPWRAQFNVDFGFHLLIVAAWMAGHVPSRWLGGLFAVLAVLGGGMFTFLYLLVQSVRLLGNVAVVLLGRHYPGQGGAR